MAGERAAVLLSVQQTAEAVLRWGELEIGSAGNFRRENLVRPDAFTSR